MASAAREITPPVFNEDEDVAFTVELGDAFIADYADDPDDLVIDYAVGADGQQHVLLEQGDEGLTVDGDAGTVTIRIAKRTLAPAKYDHLARLHRVSTDEWTAIWGGNLHIAKGVF